MSQHNDPMRVAWDYVADRTEHVDSPHRERTYALLERLYRMMPTDYAIHDTYSLAVPKLLAGRLSALPEAEADAIMAELSKILGTSSPDGHNQQE